MNKKIKIKESSTLPHFPKEETTKEDKIFEADGQLAVDVYKTDNNFVVLATVAGVLVKDIEILIDNDMLVIKGSRPNPEKKEDKNYFYQECYWGPFSRKIILPEDIDVSRAQAEFNQGILAVKFPFAQNKEKKNIVVKES